MEYTLIVGILAFILGVLARAPQIWYAYNNPESILYIAVSGLYLDLATELCSCTYALMLVDKYPSDAAPLIVGSALGLLGTLFLIYIRLFIDAKTAMQKPRKMSWWWPAAAVTEQI
jgi:hypothetical protein